MQKHHWLSIDFSFPKIIKHRLHVWGSLADCSLLSLSPSGSHCPVLRGCGLDVYYGRQFPWWRRNELCRLGSNYGLPPPPPRQPAAGVGLPLGIHTQICWPLGSLSLLTVTVNKTLFWYNLCASTLANQCQVQCIRISPTAKTHKSVRLHFVTFCVYIFSNGLSVC